METPTIKLDRRYYWEFFITNLILCSTYTYIISYQVYLYTDETKTIAVAMQQAICLELHLLVLITQPIVNSFRRIGLVQSVKYFLVSLFAILVVLSLQRAWELYTK
ncbi:MAG: hypothetical protein RL596_2434 [Bacteroidota bacterium]|jgi:hypothetical protein